MRWFHIYQFLLQNLKLQDCKTAKLQNLTHFKCNNKWLLLRPKFEFSEWKKIT